MLTGIIAFFTENKWARYVLAFVALVFGLEVIKRHLKEAGRKSERDANAIKAAKVESQIIATITENSNEMVKRGDVVRSHDAAERMPDGTGQLAPHNYRD